MERKLACNTGLLSLPDELLARIAEFTHNYCERHKELKYWARAASTCKRLSKVQLCSGQAIQNCESLRWHLKRFQHAKSIYICIEEWPRAEELQEWSKSLKEVSADLKQVNEVALRLRNWDLGPLSLWVPAMLTGARNLTCLGLDVEIVPFLPALRAKALKKLSMEACTQAAGAASKLVQAVKDCQQLERLYVLGNPAYDKDWVIPELDLRHLEHLRWIQFEGLPAPRRMFLSQGRPSLVVIISPSQVTAWSKLLHTVQADLRCIQIQGLPDRLPHRGHMPLGIATYGEVLHRWPEGIDAFHGLQFLDMVFPGIWPSAEEDVLDLACLAYIPRVFLHSTSHLSITISAGSWEDLSLGSGGTFNVAIHDIWAFMRNTGKFAFTFPKRSYPHDLIEKLEKAGGVLGITLECKLNSIALEQKLTVSHCKPKQ